MNFHAVIALLSLLTSSRAEDKDACSIVNAQTRVDCGYFGIKSAECLDKGCCWDDSVQNAPYCFNKPDTSAPDYEACSSRDPKQRMECGFFGINKTECNRRDCCYDNTVSGGVPWCFYKPDINSPDYETCSARDPNLRVECGTYGIDKPHCTDRGCCYDNSVGGGFPWCFNKPDTSSGDYEICAGIDHTRRVDCGWSGMTDQQCRDRGCCYDDSTKGAKYCFNKPDTGSPDYQTCSRINPIQRVDCGSIGTTRDECENRGCCYDNSWNGLPWCFNKPDKDLPAECSAVILADRKDCGYSGINREVCVNKGCCYDNSVRGSPWCFYKGSSADDSQSADESENSVVCGAMEPGDREMCGYVGITKAACLAKGCCYDNALRAYPWCFNKPS